MIDFVDAAHDAYARLADPVTHRRRVLFLKPRYWLIVDDLAGRAEHHVDVLFQVGTGAVTAGIEPWAWLTGPNNAGLWLCSFSTAPLERVIHNGEVDPIKGWRSSAYGERRPMPVLSCSVLAVLPLRIATVVIPGTSGPSRPPRVELVHGDRQLTGLVLLDTSEVIRIDDEFVSVETSSCAAS